ncbi:Stp1/IreP family PP2C-type Ser/Thr phosphatase [soil metagenome]
MTQLSYRYVAMTDTGLRRSENQDSGFASPRLLVIADGMGGAAAGDLASAETMYAIRQLDGPLEGDPDEALAGAVLRANIRLGELIAEDPSVEGMGTTLTALLFDGEKFTMAHIGDSRCYRLRGGKLTQITDDHTFVQSLVDEGRITREEARSHPHRSLILRALLGRDDNDPDLSTVMPQIGDRYLLCSDGLPDMVRDELIEQTLKLETVDMAAVELIRLALEAGGVDNVTVVIGEIVDAADPIDETLSSADGKPQLVGSAANGPRPRTGHAVAPSALVASAAPTNDSTTKVVDPEALRYAPLPPSRGRRWRALIALFVVVVIAAVAGTYAYNWSQKQFYVSDNNGVVTIFRGVNTHVPGITLRHVERETTISLDALPVYNQSQVRDGIEAADLASAERTIKELEVLSGECDTTQADSTCVPADATPTTPTASPTDPAPTKGATAAP